jgi:hypothetical protein
VLIILGSKRFSEAPFKNENELEMLVASNYEIVFGNHSLYLPQKSISTPGQVESIPDALVIDLQGNVWYIVEAELAKHGTWNHIVPQISREIVAAENPKTKRALISTVINEVERSEQLRKKFIELGHPEIKIQRILEEIMEKSPIIAIPIDEIPADLKEWGESLGREYRILRMEKYANEEGEVAYKVPELPGLSTPAPEEEETNKKPITEAEFLAKCEEPCRILFQKLKSLAIEKKHELRPRTQAISYYIVTKTKKFCILTMWKDTVVILKWNLNPNNGISQVASSTFLEEVGKIAQFPDRFESLKEPYLSTRQGDLTIDDINRFTLALKTLIESIQ